MMGVVHRKRGLCGFAVLLLAFPWFPSLGQSIEPTPLIEWHCWLGKDAYYSIHCFDIGDIAAADFNMFAGAPLDPQRFHRDLRSDISSPNVARLTHEDAAMYGGRLWLIPLYSYPFDMEKVKFLARPVMCWRDPRCSVRFEPAAP